MQKEIFFKATRKESNTCKQYRQIKKRGDLEFDFSRSDDDVISIWLGHGKRVSVDCDLKTGEFRMFFDDKDFEKWA